MLSTIFTIFLYSTQQDLPRLSGLDRKIAALDRKLERLADTSSLHKEAIPLALEDLLGTFGRLKPEGASQQDIAHYTALIATTISNVARETRVDTSEQFKKFCEISLRM